MLNFLKNLFKKPSKCISPNEEHDFSDWELTQVLSSRYGGKILYQTRVCKKCKYTQIDKQEK